MSGQGLYPKYRVERTDGKPVGWCFVLQDTDPLAVPALITYAESAMDAGNFDLYHDLMEKVSHLEAMHAAFDGRDEGGDQ